MNFPNYTQLYTIVEAIANAISRKKADLVPNELTDEEVENIRNLFMPTSVAKIVPSGCYIYYYSEQYSYFMDEYFNPANVLYFSQVEYSDEDTLDPQDVTSWHVWDLEHEEIHNKIKCLRLTIRGDRSAISDTEILDQFVSNFITAITPIV